MDLYDLIIIGAGPAGLTSSIYASCYHLKHLVIGGILGGQLQLAPDILNYPGFENISGKELTNRITEQVKKRGGEIITQSVTKIIQLSNQQINRSTDNNETMKQESGKDTSDGGKTTTSTPPRWRNQNDGFEIETQTGQKYQTKAMILATGTERRKLNIPGEVEYTARGVHYCATCEKFDYDGKICAVVGGANSAAQAAVEIASVASKVYIMYRGIELRGDPIWLQQIQNNKKIEVIYQTVVTEIMGDGEKLTGVRINTNNPITQLTNNQIKQISEKDTSDGGPVETVTPQMVKESRQLLLDKLFIEIGGVPGTALVIPLGVAVDNGGYIKVDERLATNVPGIFAAGDLVSYALSIEQISSAVGLGARAAASAFAYVKGEKAPTSWGTSQIKR